jgi:hypothetical protein
MKLILKILNFKRKSLYGQLQVMLHLINQPTMKERTHILQTKFLLRSLDVPDDTLLFQLLPYIRTSASGSQWYKLTTSPLWRLCTVQDVEQIDKRCFRAIRQEYLQNSLEQCRDNTNSVLLSACRVDLKVDPILWLPMTPSNVVAYSVGVSVGFLVAFPNRVFTTHLIY